MIPRLYKLAAKHPSKALFDLLEGLSKRRGDEVSLFMNTIRKPDLNTILGLKSAARLADTLFNVSGWLKHVRGAHPRLFANKAGVNSYRISLINQMLKDFNLSGVFNRNGLIGGIIHNKGLASKIVPLYNMKDKFNIVTAEDLAPLTQSLLLSKFGQMALLPRASVDKSILPSLYFGFLKDPNFNLDLYNKTIRKNPNAMSLTDLYNPETGIGRVFNTRHHSMLGKLYKLVDGSDIGATRNKGQHILRLGQDYSVNFDDLLNPINKLTVASGDPGFKIDPENVNKASILHNLIDLTNFEHLYN